MMSKKLASEKEIISAAMEYMGSVNERVAGDTSVTYASIYEYKGLDNDVILFTDIKDIDTHKISRSLHLVGATRARNHYTMYVTPQVMDRLLDPTNGNLLHSIDPEYTN